MNIIIRNSSGKPIYEQIASQIKNMIIAGELNAGDALPSMRMLAKELRISVITTQRAYAVLERDGFIETLQGKGSYFAGGNMDFIREENLRNVEQYLLQAIEAGQMAGLTLAELKETLTLLYQEDE